MAYQPFFNHGNHIKNNYGTVNQFLGNKPPLKPFRELSKLDQVGVVGGFVTAFLMVFLGVWGFYAQWQPLLAHGCGSGGFEARFSETFPRLWTVVTMAVCYVYCNTRIYL